MRLETTKRVDALPLWDNDQRDGAYIREWIVYPAGGPYDQKNMRQYSPDAFCDLFGEETVKQLLHGGSMEERP